MCTLNILSVTSKPIGIIITLGNESFSCDQFFQATSETKFKESLEVKNISEAHCNAFLNQVSRMEDIINRKAVMFLTQILWESGGLQHREEIQRKDKPCPECDSIGGGDSTIKPVPEKSYHDHGCLQLSHPTTMTSARQLCTKMIHCFRILSLPPNLIFLHGLCPPGTEKVIGK